MTSAQHARSKAAIAHFIGDDQMWQEAMWQLRCCYAEYELFVHYGPTGKLTYTRVKK